MSSERRRDKRLDANLFVDIVNLTLKEPVGRGVAVDVSISGFGIDGEMDLNLNETYECYMEVPLVIKAKLVRREIKGQMKRYGFKFANLGFFDKLLLKKILKSDRTTKKV
jgi:hypothetical protein